MPIQEILTDQDLGFRGLLITGVETNLEQTLSAASDVETTLHSFVLPANWLGRTGDGISFEYGGVLAPTSSNTTFVKILLGQAGVFDSGLFKATAGGPYVLEGSLYRAADGGVLGFVKFLSADLTVITTVSSGPDLTIASSLDLLAQGHVAGDVSKILAALDFRGSR